MSDFLTKIRQLALVEENRPLSTLTTFRIGGKARYVVYPKDILSLGEILRIIKEEKLDYKVIGKGSNLLCSDLDYPGVIIKFDKFFLNSYYDGEDLIAQAGISIIVLAYDSMKKGLSGLEFASGIPGTLGGTIYMNAGAYKASMADLVREVLVLRNGKLDWISNHDCHFAYRTSVFQQHPEWIILAAKLHLKKENVETIRSLIDERRKRRMETQPLDYPSAGSIFRNPQNDFAWKYIDELGLRGKCVGQAQISEKHSNFIINKGQAKGEDVAGLIKLVNKQMKTNFGFELKTEVEWFNWPKKK